MRLRFLGKESTPGDSPTLFATDRESYIVQGWKVTDPEILAKLNIPEDETIVEVPVRLMAHLTNDGLTGTVTNWKRPIVHVRDMRTFIFQGRRVTNAEALGQMRIPDYEDCVEISKAEMLALIGRDYVGADH